MGTTIGLKIGTVRAGSSGKGRYAAWDEWAKFGLLPQPVYRRDVGGGAVREGEIAELALLHGMTTCVLNITR